MRFFNKLAKLIVRIFLIVFSILGLAVDVLVGVFGYIAKTPQLMISFLEQLSNGEEIPANIVNSINSFASTGESIFIAAVSVAAIFLGCLLIWLITIPFSRKKKEK